MAKASEVDLLTICRGAVPQLFQFALFETDGGAWRIAAIGLIASWLKNRISTSTVDALASLPIIS